MAIPSTNPVSSINAVLIFLGNPRADNGASSSDHLAHKKQADALQKFASDYNVDAKALGSGIRDLKHAVKANDATGIDSAIKDIVDALKSPSASDANSGSPDAAAQNQDNSCDSTDGASGDNEDAAAQGQGNSGDTEEEAALRKLLQSVGIKPSEIDRIMQQLNDAQAQGSTENTDGAAPATSTCSC